MNCEMPIINSTNEEIKKILENTKSIAIVGCSPNPEKASHKVAKYLIENGYTIYPIYPKEDKILGEKVYRSLKDIPFKVDMVDIFRKPSIISSIVDICIERGDIDCVWSQLGLINNTAMEKAQEHGIKTVQNYCTKIEHQLIFNHQN